MKLYATTSSERASKGQGGEYLDIEIMGHNKVVIARALVRTSLEHGYTIELYPVAYPDMLKLDIKGHGYKVTRKDIECKHIFKTAIYENKKLQGFQCNACDKLIKINPQFQKGNNQKGDKVWRHPVWGENNWENQN
jgi:hypothetical protein